MNITIQEDPALEETQVVIRCKQADAPVLEMIAALRSFDQNFDQKLTGLREGQTFLLDFHQVLYIDTADGRTFSIPRSRFTKRPCGCMSWKSGFLGGSFCGPANRRW